MSKPNKTHRILIFSLASFFLFSVNQVVFSQSTKEQVEKKDNKYDYLTYVPENYKSRKNKDWPLLIYLHGASLRGNDINKIKKYGMPYLVEEGHDYDFFIVSPQCPANKNWSMDNWMDTILQEIESKYHIDTNRIYLIGMSLGGYGAWELAIKYPMRFAAIVPVCGGGDTAKVCVLKDVPIWAFHGSADSIVPVSETENMVSKLKQCQGNVKYTQLEGRGHGIVEVFEMPEVFDWMLAQRKR
jgi:predicted peptidase